MESETFRVLICQVGLPATVEKYESQNEIRKLINDLIRGEPEELYPFDDQPNIALVCNYFGVMDELEPNRAILEPNGTTIRAVIRGPFFLAWSPPECDGYMDFPDQILDKVCVLFEKPHRFFFSDGAWHFEKSEFE